MTDKDPYVSYIDGILDPMMDRLFDIKDPRIRDRALSLCLVPLVKERADRIELLHRKSRRKNIKKET